MSILVLTSFVPFVFTTFYACIVCLNLCGPPRKRHGTSQRPNTEIKKEKFLVVMEN